MFRKFFAAIVASMLVAGGLFADEIKAVFVKFDEGKLTVKVDDKEKVYTVDKDAKTKFKKKGDTDFTEVLLTDTLGKMKADSKITLTVEKDVVTKVAREKKAK